MTSGQAISKLKHDKKYSNEVIESLEKEHKALKIIKEKLYSWSKLYINTDEQRVSNMLTIYDIDDKEKKLLKEVLL